MPVELIYTVQDRKGKTATTSVKLGSGEIFSRVETFHAAFAQALDNLIGGLIRSAFAVLGVDLSGLTGNAEDPDSDNEDIGAFEFVTTQGNRVKFNLPGIDELQVDNSTGELDQTDPDIAAIITMFEDGIAVTGGTILPCDIGEDDIVGLLFARERWRNSGKRKV